MLNKYINGSLILLNEDDDTEEDDDDIILNSEQTELNNIISEMTKGSIDDSFDILNYTINSRVGYKNLVKNHKKYEKNFIKRRSKYDSRLTKLTEEHLQEISKLILVALINFYRYNPSNDSIYKKTSFENVVKDLETQIGYKPYTFEYPAKLEVYINSIGKFVKML